MSLGVWCDICGAFDQDMLSHLKIHSEQKRVIELRTSISGENTTKKECDHIVGFLSNNQDGGAAPIHQSDSMAKVLEASELLKYCPECGEKLNLKKDE